MLNDQLRSQLRHLTNLIEPHISLLDRKFQAGLKRRKHDVRPRAALLAITLGAGARILVKLSPELGLRRFFEHVEYHGRRLAKMNLPPSVVAAALERYNAMLGDVVARLAPQELHNFQWVRDQLHFCVILTLNNAYYKVREAESSAFYELFRIELEAKNLRDLLRRSLEALAVYCRADEAGLYFYNRETGTWSLEAAKGTFSVQKVTEKGVSETLSRPWSGPCGKGAREVLAESWRGKFATVWSVPMTSGERTDGVIQFAFAKPYEWLPREQELLYAAAERCLLAAEKARLVEDLAAREEQVRQLAAHMLQVEEMERRRVSRELHDEAGQSLLCIRLQLEMLEEAIPEERADLRERLREARRSTERTIIDIRRLIAALSPAVLEQLGLESALKQLVKRFVQLHEAKVRVQMHGLEGLPKEVNVIAYRLVQECFNNIAKHSEASAVNLFVGSADGSLKLNVEDNGKGFDLKGALARRESFGLAGMMERVALLGGKFEIESCPAGRNGSANGRAAAAGIRRNGMMAEGRATMGRMRRGRSGTSIAIELPVP